MDRIYDGSTPERVKYVIERNYLQSPDTSRRLCWEQDLDPSLSYISKSVSYIAGPAGAVFFLALVSEQPAGSAYKGTVEREGLIQEYGRSYGESDHSQLTRNCQTQGHGYPNQPQVITSKMQRVPVTQGTVMVTYDQFPPDTLLPAIWSCLCFFWPAGIVAIIFACLARHEKDSKKAWARYRVARSFIWISVVAGVICFFLVIVLRRTVLNN